MIRHSLRAIHREPGFTISVVLTLGLGIGASASMYGLVDSLVVESLRIGDPDRVVRLLPDHDRFGESDETFALADLRVLRREAEAFGWIAAFDGWAATLETADQAQRIDAAIVTSDYFEVLGVDPLLGRFLTADDEGPNSEGAVVLSHDFWRIYMGGDSAAVGRSVRLNGSPLTVVGVAPPEMEDPRLARGGQKPPVLWRSAPRSWFEGQLAQHGVRAVTAFARLAPGASLETAGSQADAVFAGLAERFPDTNREWGVSVVPLKERILASVDGPLRLLSAMVALLMLIATLNVANLFLIRAATRQRDLAVRASLGADRRDLLHQLTIEGGVLAVLACLIGMMFAGLIVRFLPVVAAGQIPRLEFLVLDWSVVYFSLGLTLATTVLLGLVPLLALPKAPAVVLSSSAPAGAATGGDRRGRHFFNILLGLQAGSTLVLLATAGLLVRSYTNLTTTDPGYAFESVLTMRFQVSPRSHDTDSKVRQAFDQILEETESIPGVRAAGFGTILPLSGGYWSAEFSEPEGGDLPPDVENRRVQLRAASPGFLAALQMDVVSGRGLQRGDRYGEPAVAVVNAAMAETYWPGQSAAGRRVELFGGSYEIVGVVESIRDEDLRVPPDPTIYLSHHQAPTWLTRYSALTIAGESEPQVYAHAARSAFGRVDRRIPVYEVRPLSELVREATAPQRFRTVLLSMFALLAFTLAGVGVYSVISYSLAKRTRELGIRLALGAPRRQLRWMVALRELRPILAGLGVGLVVFFTVAPRLSGFLYGVHEFDTATIVGALGVFMGASYLAALGPIRQALNASPADVLRDQ